MHSLREEKASLRRRDSRRTRRSLTYDNLGTGADEQQKEQWTPEEARPSGCEKRPKGQIRSQWWSGAQSPEPPGAWRNSPWVELCLRDVPEGHTLRRCVGGTELPGG